jgi:hypothetical protein
LVKRIVFGCSAEFLPFDNDVYITPHYSDMMRGLLPLYPSGTMNAAALDGASCAADR